MSVRKLLVTAVLALAAPGAAHAAPTHYVPMSDGVKIAINVVVPEHCLERRCPAFLEMSGYESGSDEGKTPAGHLADDTGLPLPLQTGTRAAHAARAGIDKRYVTVLASVRGTGCSNGEFDVFSWRSALDGRELIDGWIARQAWSNGDVVIFGHSYSGLTGMMVAATQPRHLRAVTASGLFGDVYRDIVYPGGVANYGFPLLWTGGVRPVYDIGGGTVGGLYPVEDTSAECAANQAGRSREVMGEPLTNGLDDTDSDWYRSRSLVNAVGRITVPVHVTAAYQDEQTGARGPTHVFDRLPAGVPRRLVLVNGQHGTQTEDHVWKDRVAWMDHWLLGTRTADLGFGQPAADLATVFGTGKTSKVILDYMGGGKAAGRIDSDGFPLGQTQWSNLYLGRGGLSASPSLLPGSTAWAHGSRRQSYTFQAGSTTGGELSSPTGPDEVELSSAPFTQPFTVAGPVTANLFVSSTAPDTELFVQVLDRAPDGTLLYLNRGMLRGSHRQVDLARSQAFKGHVYRPWRPHEARALVAPGQVVEYAMDIWPFGHVFKPGHRLVVKLHAPPAEDNDYAYILKTAPAINRVHFGPRTPSRITLPAIPSGAVTWLDPVPAGCPYASMRCLAAR